MNPTALSAHQPEAGICCLQLQRPESLNALDVPALKSAHAVLDPRGPREWLQFVRAYARELVFVDDADERNQGDWRGSSPLQVVTKGSFNGHPASLVWTAGWNQGDPLALPVETLEKLRVQPAGIFIQGELSNSPTQPAVFPKSWGALAGQVVFGEMNASRLVRFVGEDIGGVHQGAMIPFLDTKTLRNGNHRLAFAPDGALHVGKTHLSWAGNNGIMRIEAPKSLPPLIESVHLLAKGFEVRFTTPIAFEG